MPKGRIKPLDLIKILKKHGFVEHHRKGSHCMLKNPKTGKYTVVPVHNKELGIGITLAIINQAGLDRSLVFDK
ncbi:MAG: type II toxin-antitoxin system HicA family toxin [Candidatus Absconditabacteria bacterium]|nr:type II toxin-antitoxin system HicA family toxin [Candidatus Absconditabacteria bacterium]